MYRPIIPDSFYAIEQLYYDMERVPALFLVCDKALRKKKSQTENNRNFVPFEQAAKGMSITRKGYDQRFNTSIYSVRRDLRQFLAEKVVEK